MPASGRMSAGNTGLSRIFSGTAAALAKASEANGIN